MSITLTLHTSPQVPLEAENISPDRMAKLAIAEIERLPVCLGNRTARIGDFFKVDGTPGPDIHLMGDLSKVKYIGCGMSCGSIAISGNVGLHLGTGMTGGRIKVAGDAGDWVGPGLSGGSIEITGSAGHMVGGAYRGNAVGITGGQILVHGDVGNEAGHGMRNGLIAVAGNTGDFTGVNMLAGTIIVLGKPGIRTGAGMKRGSIACMRSCDLLSTFSYACSYNPGYLRMYLLHLKAAGIDIPVEYIAGNYERWLGDAIELNRGEILLYKHV